MNDGIMARRKALVGKQVELLGDHRTVRGVEFKRGELLTVNDVGRGATPIRCSAPDGRRIRVAEWSIREVSE